ncbi:hypothetical protein K435DRAFT_860356 [Dendrothele bispora CBS 962.96]|uniref:Uncharacterized protein n=1 Tax=Dendrothele bispora (strain CBS 962.96) TaxID=1314807 RepID=A0A4S8LZE7_DENBC|nr:hypothetical protein K435DRAFT_860356 [Dendrothele bispora CBS 962.96]
MDLPKARFLAEKTCRVSCINKIYNNPPIETSYLDCIQAKRRLPCDLCRARYDLLDLSAITFPSSADPSVLPPFDVSIKTAEKIRKGRKRVDQLNKKEVVKVRQALDEFGTQVWLEERVRLPHRNIPQCFYLPSDIIDLVVSELLKINSLEALVDKLKPMDWIFKESQASNLFIFMKTVRSEIQNSRKSISKGKEKMLPKKKQNSDCDSNDSDVSEPLSSNLGSTVDPLTRPKTRKRPALDEVASKNKLPKRNVTMSAAEAKQFYARPTYNISRQSEGDTTLRHSSRRRI